MSFYLYYCFWCESRISSKNLFPFSTFCSTFILCVQWMENVNVYKHGNKTIFFFFSKKIWFLSRHLNFKASDMITVLNLNRSFFVTLYVLILIDALVALFPASLYIIPFKFLSDICTHDCNFTSVLPLFCVDNTIFWFQLTFQ